MRNSKITISGELGSGKTVLGKLLCEKLFFKLISVGGIQRDMAQSYGMTTLDFNKYMETHPEIDTECDNKVIGYGLSAENLILDSRMAWHFVPHAFKIHLIVSNEIAAKRILADDKRKNETYSDLKEAMEQIKSRKNSEVKRFKEQYNVDIDDLSNYNLIIDTSYISPEELADFVVKKFLCWQNEITPHNIWLSPINLIPTQSIKEHSGSYSQPIGKSIIDEQEPVKIIKWDNYYYFIYDGHKRISASIQIKQNLIPALFIEKKDTLSFDQSVEEYLKDNYSITNVNEWEDMHDLKFNILTPPSVLLL